MYFFRSQVKDINTVTVIEIGRYAFKNITVYILYVGLIHSDYSYFIFCIQEYTRLNSDMMENLST